MHILKEVNNQLDCCQRKRNVSEESGIKSWYTSEKNANKQINATSLYNFFFQEMFNSGNLFCRRQTKDVGSYNGIAECCREFPTPKYSFTFFTLSKYCFSHSNILRLHSVLEDFIFIPQAHPTLLNLQSAKLLFHYFWKRILFYEISFWYWKF